MTGKVTSYLVAQKLAISSADPGSCPANWLQGKPSTTRPASRCCRHSASNPSYCGVKPHLDAVLTTSTTLPRWAASGWGAPDGSLTLKS